MNQKLKDWSLLTVVLWACALFGTATMWALLIIPVVMVLIAYLASFDKPSPYIDPQGQ